MTPSKHTRYLVPVAVAVAAACGLAMGLLTYFLLHHGGSLDDMFLGVCATMFAALACLASPKVNALPTFAHFLLYDWLIVLVVPALVAQAAMMQEGLLVAAGVYASLFAFMLCAVSAIRRFVLRKTHRQDR